VTDERGGRGNGDDSVAKISVLILSWRRLENLSKILSSESAYGIVDEIIVFNNYSLSTIAPLNQKTKILNSSYDFGLRSRWALGLLARNRCLVFQDDDILIAESGFHVLYDRWMEDV